MVLWSVYRGISVPGVDLLTFHVQLGFQSHAQVRWCHRQAFPASSEKYYNFLTDRIKNEMKCGSFAGLLGQFWPEESDDDCWCVPMKRIYTCIRSLSKPVYIFDDSWTCIVIEVSNR